MSKREDALVLAISAINNNPMLFTPFRDDHQIEVAMPLAEACGRIDLVAEYLPAISSRMVYRYERRFDWVTCLQDYRRLAIHPARRDDEYFMCSTAGSILVPFVLVGLEHLRVQEDLEELQRIVNEKLAHVTKQVWVPHEGTDSTIWRVGESVGTAVTVPALQLEGEDHSLSDEVDEIALEHDAFYQLEAVRRSISPPRSSQHVGTIAFLFHLTSGSAPLITALNVALLGRR